MNRNGLKRIKAAAVLITVLLMMNIQMLTAFAATARIAFSDPTVKVGDEFSVTMKITTGDGKLGKADVMLAYDSSILEFVSGTGASGGAGSIKVSGASDTAKPAEMSFSLKFKATQAGKANITISDQEIYDLDGQAVTVNKQGSSAVTITPLASYSKDASLASLQISPGTLTPAFSADVEEYTATVGVDVDKIIVSAPSSDSKAKVVISGNDNLKVGENKLVCKVTAEDGETVKNYTITVTKTEEAQPAGQTGTANAGGIKVETIAKTVTIVPLDEGVTVPAGLVENSLTIKGEKVQGWIAAGDGQNEYCVVYAMNADGEKNFYRYDMKERTMQRYFDSAAGNQTQSVISQIEDYNQLVHDYDMRFIIIMALIAVCVVLFIIILVLLFRKGGHNEPYDDEDFREDDEDDLFKKRTTKEERYLRGLEAEEEDGVEHSSSAPAHKSRGQKKTASAAKLAQAETAASYPDRMEPETKTAPLPKAAPSPKAAPAAKAAQPPKAAPAAKPAPAAKAAAKSAPVRKPVPEPVVEDDDDDFEVLDI